MTYCKPSQPFQAREGGGRVEKEEGRTIKKKIRPTTVFVHLPYRYVTKKHRNIIIISDFDLINSCVFTIFVLPVIPALYDETEPVITIIALQ